MRILSTTLATMFILCITGCNNETAPTSPEAAPAPPPAHRDATAPAVAGDSATQGNTLLAGILGETLINAEGVTTAADQIHAEKIGLYFSAIWCPPCRNFTPLLVDAYNELQSAGESFEIVFVSADRSAADLKRYMIEYNMPWQAIPFDANARAALPQQHRVRGIPSLVIIDAEGNVLSPNAVAAIRDQGARAFANW